VGSPAVRAFPAGHEEEGIGEHGRRRGGKEDRHKHEDRGYGGVHEPDRYRNGGVVQRADQRIRNPEEARPGRFYDAWALDFATRGPPALVQHEKRGIEPNTAQHRDDRPDYHRLNRILRRSAALALLAASFALAFLVIRHQPRVAHEIRTIGPLAYPLAVGVFVVVASAPFSVTDALAIMNGAIFGPIKGTLVDAFGLVGAALLGYWINRHASRLWSLEEYLHRLPAWVKRFPVGSPAFLLAVRTIPGFGGTVATATAAAFRVPIWVHVWTMCAIAIPICALLTIFGDRVTVALHGYEWRAGRYARHYCQTHRCPHFHFRRRETPSPPP
jgi:uncharacterized membrane protein YdjX (TVP38/TMEM64 family)